MYVRGREWGRRFESGIARSSVTAAWLEGPLSPGLGPRDVHVWSMALPSAPTGPSKLERYLSAAELNRAARFAFAIDRARFIAGRVLLRTILAQYCGISPAAIRFRTNEYGKPSLEWGRGQACDIEFNFSRSHTIALCALCRGRVLGVDVERERPLSGLEEIAERYFSARESAALRALPAELRSRAFFACWSRKEAYIKARGLGLSLALSSFDVNLVPCEPAALLSAHGDPDAAAEWSLFELRPAANYAAALVVERAGRAKDDEAQVSCYHWPAERVDVPLSC